MWFALMVYGLYIRTDAVLLLPPQSAAAFQVTLLDDERMLMSLDSDDVRPDVSVYAVRVSGEPHTHTLMFPRPADAQTLPPPLEFNASYHGLCYSISLMIGNHSASRVVRTVAVMTSETAVNHQSNENREKSTRI
ncbi:hypothetical protein PO909_028489 [Leuciscus waleckii]